MRGGATIYNGRLFRQSLDCHVIALDIKTGKQIWKQKFADYKEGYIGVIAPLVANGVVITGMAGGDRTTRGFLDGWDPDTGQHLWRRYTIPNILSLGPLLAVFESRRRPAVTRIGTRNRFDYLTP